MTEIDVPRRLLVVRGGGIHAARSGYSDWLIDLYREAGVEVTVVDPNDMALIGANPTEAILDDPLARLQLFDEASAIARKRKAPPEPFEPSNRKARRAAAARSRQRK